MVHCNMKARSGFTLIEILIAVVTIALLTAIAIPAFLQYRQDAQTSMCVNCLRLIHHAKQWRSLLAGYINSSNVLYCPAMGPGSHYVYNPVGELPTCPLAASFPDHVLDLNRGH
jgi:prepilin-type N-terminal cleavage/methylation domain-containing protein